MTDQPENLAAALVALQEDMPVIRKATDGQFGKYADLAIVVKELRPVMARLGLAFTAKPTIAVRESGDREFVLAYKLVHAPSGQSDAGEYPLPQGTPQALGSAITYARRYALCAITGAVADTDDDGRAASQDNSRPARGSRARPPERAPGNLPRNGDGSVSRSRVTDPELAAAGLMTSDQQAEHTALRRGADGKLPRAESRKIEHGPADDDPWLDVGPEPLRTPVAAQNPAQVIVMHFNRLGFAADERQQRLNIIAALAGRESVTSTNDLTVAEGVRVKAALEKCRDRGALVELMAAGGTGE